MSIDTSMDTEVLTIPYEDTDDGDWHRTHIVNPPMNLGIGLPGMSAKEIVDTARMLGKEVTALCGYKWVPVRNPEKYDACPKCIKIAHDIMRERGE